MSEPSQPAELRPKSAAPPVAVSVAPPAPGAAPATSTIPASKLTPEEQMAAFEKDLKQHDWGHQPC